MKALWRRLTALDDPAAWSRWLAAWRLWLLAGLLAAALAALAYPFLPLPWRARAEVVVDHDLEAALPAGTDRHLFYYLSRENKKLEALAWADDVLAPVAQALGTSPADLRRGDILTLRQEKDGLWHFWATASDPAVARAAAAAWAQAFVAAAQDARAAAQEAENLRVQQRALAEKLAETRFLCAHLAQIQAELQALPPPPETSPWQAWALWERLAWLHGGVGDLPPWPADTADGRALLRAARDLAQARVAACPQQVAALEAQLDALARAQAQALQRARGISPFVSVTPSQTAAEGLPLRRTVGRGTAMLAAALLAWAGLGLALLFRGGREA